MSQSHLKRGRGYSAGVYVDLQLELAGESCQEPGSRLNLRDFGLGAQGLRAWGFRGVCLNVRLGRVRISRE